MSDPAQKIAHTIWAALSDQVGPVHADEGEQINWVDIHGTACVRVELVDGRTFLVDVNEGPLA